MVAAEALRRFEVEIDPQIASFFAYVEEQLPDVATHCVRTARVADEIGSMVSVSDDERALLWSAALLHDIGKVWIPLKILHKPASLTPNERTIMQDHVVLGPKYISRFDGNERLALVVGQHHERFDGRGYPLGLSGDELDRLSRILAVADVFCAATEDRPYQAASSPEIVRSRIMADRGKHFDPVVVDAFATINIRRLASLAVS